MNAHHRRLFSFLKPYRRRFIFALLAMAGYGATDGAVPLLIRRILDDIFGAQDRSMLTVLPAILVAFAIIRGALGFTQTYLMAGIGLGIVRDLRNQIHERLLVLSQTFFDQNPSGTLISRVTNDTLQVRQALTDSVSAFLRDTVRVIALLCTAIYLDPVLGLFAFVVFPLGILPVLKFGKRVRKLSRVGQDRFGGLTSVLNENISGHTVIQSFSLENRAAERFRSENDSLTKTFIRAEKYGALSGPTNEILASLAMSAVILYGGYSVLSGVRTQGDFIAFMTAMFLLYEPLKKLGRANTTFQTGLAASERIFELLDQVPDVTDPVSPRELPRKPAAVEYRNVSFRYGLRSGEEQEAAWAIENLSLSVRAGETIAIVGMSGGGKSTFVKLLPRFYDPQLGEVLIDGVDIRKYSLSSLRSAVSVVTQHPFLFHDTVAENILQGRPSATMEEVITAAKAAHVHEFVEKLPLGYDTVVGEQGMSLSGGERARVAIARAILKDSPILVLDEATASLDSKSEMLVQDAIDRLMEGRTVFVIAHRLATIRRASRIAVLSRGRLVELGTHQELLERGGEYAKLHTLQFQDTAVREERVSL